MGTDAKLLKRNVLIFPAGSENALEIYEALKNNLHFDLFGASGKADHAQLVYPPNKLHIGNLYVTDTRFLNEINRVISTFQIEFIIPTHDTVALELMKNQEVLKAKIICSPYYTTLFAREKKLFYERLCSTDLIPKIYNNMNLITEYPVFLKPNIGEGGSGVAIANHFEDVKRYMANRPDGIVSEFLPGEELTVDCFTDRNHKLLFVGPRTRERITNGMSYRTRTVVLSKEIKRIAKELNRNFIFRGGWFFQIKKDKQSCWKVMEISVRGSTSMMLYRMLGINFAALSLFDFMGYPVSIIYNDYAVTMDRCLTASFRLEYEYDTVYVDFDDTLIVNNMVNGELLSLLYQFINRRIRIILLTKHEFKIKDSLAKYRISESIFDEIVELESEQHKCDYIFDIGNTKALFIDNYFVERQQVKAKCGIPVFDVDAVLCLKE